MNCIEKIKNFFSGTVALLKRGFESLGPYAGMVVKVKDIYAERYEILGLVFMLSLTIPVISAFNFQMPKKMFNIFLTEYLVALSIPLFLVLYSSAFQTINIYCIICERSLKMRIGNLGKDEYLVRWEEKKYYEFVESSKNVSALTGFGIPDVLQDPGAPQ